MKTINKKIPIAAIFMHIIMKDINKTVENTAIYTIE